MNQKKAALHNLGCKVNSYELEAMQQLLEAAGYEIVPFEEKADVYVVNTCTVTGIADRKSRQMLHRAKKSNPDAVVVAAGCYVQTGREDLLADDSVDILLGTNHKGDIIRALEEFDRTSGRTCEVEEAGGIKQYEDLCISRTAEKARAFIKVTDGCNQFCSYCLIPYARGRVRSRKPDDVIREVRSLAGRGYQEIVLTGIHLSSYGTDLSGGQPGESLLSLIRSLSETEGIHRIRLGSLEPGIITTRFVEGLAECREICPHFHLSLQSGCDETLSRMNRRYTTAQYREKCRLLRQYFDHPALTTDVIVGFPGETEYEFIRSKEFIDSIGFYETHVFRYSKREGTRAALMDGQVDESVKAARSDQMLELNTRHMREYEEAMIGRTVQVLIEEIRETDGQSFGIGHSMEYIPVAVPYGDGVGPGKICRVTATGFLQPHLLRGLYFPVK